MPPAHSVGNQKKSTMDRLSNLPHNVTQIILECLPLRDAARTSILSSHWKHQWTSISRLVLDEEFFTSILSRKAGTADTSLNYSKAVYDILLCLTGPICKFDLYLPRWFPKNTDVNRWIEYAHGKGVKELTLEDGRHQEKNLPTCLFSCVGLTSLTLVSCKLVSLPPTFRGFPCLVSLKLDHPIVEMNLLELLISKCPLVKTLYLDIIPCSSNLTICAPKLRDLFVAGYLHSLYLEGTSGIITLALDVLFFQLQNSSYMSEFFSCVLNVEKLILGKWFWKPIKWFRVPGIFPIQMERLKSLRLVEIPLHCHSIMCLALCLISSSPLLEQLYIETKAPSLSEEVFGDGPSIQVNGLCNLRRLRNIQLVGISALSNELQLIKLLLAYSPVLEEMSIVLSAEMGGAEEKYNFAKESLRCCRSSPYAEIIINT